jgi:hypothetical protein
VPFGGGVVHLEAQMEQELYAHDSENRRIFLLMKKYTIERFIHIFK